MSETIYTIINKTVITRLVSLLDWTYKLGVKAAHELEDEGLTRDFLEKANKPGVYGLLSEEPLYIDWQEWSLRLMHTALRLKSNAPIKTYFNKMGRFGNNFLSCFLPISMIFYCRGIKDYMAAPGAVDYAIFEGRTRVTWTPEGLRPIDKRIMVNELQMISYDLERRDIKVWESETFATAKKIALPPKHYQIFRRAVGLQLVGNLKH